jgi:hypothetical protein
MVHGDKFRHAGILDGHGEVVLGFKRSQLDGLFCGDIKRGEWFYGVVDILEVLLLGIRRRKEEVRTTLQDGLI